MAIQRLKERTHLKLYSGCHRIFFNISKLYGPKVVSNTDLIKLLLTNNHLEQFFKEKELSAIKEFKNFSSDEQEEYLKLYIFTDKEYRI